MNILQRLQQEQATITASLDEIAQRETLTPEELSESYELLDRRSELDERIAALQAEEAEATHEQREAAAAAAHAGQERSEAGSAVITREARTYSREEERRGVSFIKDVVAQATSPGYTDADQRLGRHMQEERTERGDAIDARSSESRAVGTGAFTGLVVPQYLVDLAAPIARAQRPFADICEKLDLPDDGMEVNISRGTTGTSTGVQASENAEVSNQDYDDTLLTVPVRTIAGQQKVSFQAIQRGRGTDTVVMRDLLSSYNTTLDSQILNNDGTSGTHKGVRSVSGIQSVTYTDASPTAAELYPKLFNLISDVQGGVFMGISHFVMNPRRWWWIASQVGTNHPFIRVNGEQSAGEVSTRRYGGVVGHIATVPVVVDGNMVTNLGTGTDEDVVLGVTAEECYLWEDNGAPMFIRAQQAVQNLQEQLVVYGYSAFTAGRYPGAHGTIGGTGLVDPSF